MVQKTPLYEEHLALNAQMVDFFGWSLPLHYGSQIQEHIAVRNSAGMFDVSHMNIVDSLGAADRQFLRYLLANDIDRLAHPGKALYSCMLNEHGGIIDDLIVYARASDNYRLVLNAATRTRDLAWLKEHSNGLAVYLHERTEFAMIAIQGPDAIAKTMEVLNSSQMDAVSTLHNFESVDVGDWFFSRTGYTGESGFEVILPAKEAPAFWKALHEKGVTPCGLGARDSLRLEAGFCLYGQDMNDTTTPLESALEWTVAWNPLERDFIGRTAITMQKERGAKRQLVGLILEGKGVMRAKSQVKLESGVGVVTSGGYSPTLKKSIALARIPAGKFETCQVSIRDEWHSARIVAPRFVKNGKVLVE